MTDCQCDIIDGGFCERHQVKKSASWVKLCRQRGKYWQAWESGRGPSQRKSPYTSRTQPPPILGPGWHTKRLLAMFGIAGEEGCGCTSYAAKMDHWGPDGCRERMAEILDHMAEQAENRGLPFLRVACKTLVSHAIRCAEKSRIKARIRAI